jgi:invasion protein IalB
MGKKSGFLRRSLMTLILTAGVAGLGYGAFKAVPLVLETAAAHAETKPVQPVQPAQPVLASNQQPAPVATAETLMAQAATTSTTTTTTKHDGWTVTCNEGGDPPKKICSANYRVIDKKSSSNILVWLIGRNAEGKLLAEFLTLPGVIIEPGVAVSLDEAKAVKADYVSCSAKGCKASMELTPNLTRQLKAAKKAKIDITRLDGKVLQFSMDIPGIDAALADLGA